MPNRDRDEYRPCRATVLNTEKKKSTQDDNSDKW